MQAAACTLQNLRNALDFGQFKNPRFKTNYKQIKMAHLENQFEQGEQELMQEINRRFRSKDDLYNYLTAKTMIFLPRKEFCTLHFMQQLLIEEKVMQTQREVPVNPAIPPWPELALRKVWPEALQLPGIRDRLPDEWRGDLRTDRRYFWITLISQHQRWVKDLLKDCGDKRRRRAAARQMPRETIKIKPAMAKKLLQHQTGIRGPDQPLRGPSIFARRARRERPPVRGVQPAPIVPNFRTQEYLQNRYEVRSQDSVPPQLPARPSGAGLFSLHSQLPQNMPAFGANMPRPPVHRQGPACLPQVSSGRSRASSFDLSWGNIDDDGQQLPQYLRDPDFNPEIVSCYASTCVASDDIPNQAFDPANDRFHQDPWEIAYEAMLEEQSEQEDDESLYQPSQPAQPVSLVPPREPSSRLRK